MKHSPPPASPSEKGGSLLLSGWYGGGNVGDEAILAALLQMVRDERPDLAVAALSVDPGYTAAAHGLRAIPRQPLAALLAIRRCTGFALGGGGTVQDVTSVYNLPSFLIYPLLAKRLGKRVVWSGVGVGPLRTRLGRRLAWLAGQQADAISVRDEASATLLRGIGVAAAKVRVTADPALHLRPQTGPGVLKLIANSGIHRGGAESDGLDALHVTQPGSVLEGRRPLVVFAVRRPLDPALHGLRPGYLLPVSLRERFHSWSAAGQKLYTETTAKLAQLADYWAGLGADVLFIPFDPVDALVNAAVIAQMRQPGAAHQLAGRHHPAVVMGVVNRADVVVAMRLHALIFAAACGKPALAVSYDRKVSSFMAQVGLANYCHPLQGGDLRGAAADLWQNRDIIAATLGARVESLKGRAVENSTILIGAADGSRA